MNTQCSNCGMRLAQSWTFCPHCGIGITHELRHQEPLPPLQKTSVKGGFGGLAIGLVVAPICIMVGTLLCLTGLGAILGVPMIIAGILAPLAGPVFGLGEHQGKCPSCGTAMVSIADGLAHNCPACNKEFALGTGDAKAG